MIYGEVDYDRPRESIVALSGRKSVRWGTASQCTLCCHAEHTHKGVKLTQIRDGPPVAISLCS